MIGLSVSPRRRSRRTTTGQPDLVAPILAALSLDEGAGTFGFDGDEAGALHWVVDTTSSYADADALVAAKPTAAVSGSALALAGTNAGFADLSGLTSGGWQFHVGVIDAAGNASNVLSTAFTIVSGNLELSGDPLVWNGDQLIFNAA